MQTSMNEIADIKLENGKLIEKCKNEQRTNIKYKEDLKKMKKYEKFFEAQRQKKFRNCGCQVGPALKSLKEEAPVRLSAKNLTVADSGQVNGGAMPAKQPHSTVIYKTNPIQYSSKVNKENK